jgi:hypothetical protein
MLTEQREIFDGPVLKHRDADETERLAAAKTKKTVAYWRRRVWEVLIAAWPQGLGATEVWAHIPEKPLDIIRPRLTDLKDLGLARKGEMRTNSRGNPERVWYATGKPWTDASPPPKLRCECCGHVLKREDHDG